MKQFPIWANQIEIKVQETFTSTIKELAEATVEKSRLEPLLQNTTVNQREIIITHFVLIKI